MNMIEQRLLRRAKGRENDWPDLEIHKHISYILEQSRDAIERGDKEHIEGVLTLVGGGLVLLADRHGLSLVNSLDLFWADLEKKND